MTAQIQSMSIIEAEDARAAAVVNAGNPSHEIAMLGIPPVTLGALLACEAALSSTTATPEQKRAAAEILVRSSHRPHRIAAAPYLMEATE